MRVNFAHFRERTSSGHWISLAVFDAKANSGSDDDNARLLKYLTAKATATGLTIDQSALAYIRNNRPRFYGSRGLVKYLSRHGVPQWTHQMDA